MNIDKTTVIRIEPVTYIDPSTDKEKTRDYEVRQCITCGKEFHTPVGSSDTSASSLYCGEHYSEYKQGFYRRLSNVDWSELDSDMKDGAPHR